MLDSQSSTVVGASILVRGNLEGDEDLTVLGRIEGTINLTKTLDVSESGVVKAEIQVRNAVISGVVVGNITATDSVQITEVGRVVGDIRAPRVIIIDGARFRGTVDMGDLDAPRATGVIPARTVGRTADQAAMTRSRPAATTLPPRRTPVIAPKPAVAVAPKAEPKKEAPVAKAAPARAKIAPKAAPKAAGKKIKKKVVVKKRKR
ncbi:polymer-forming cytoskeletal protein [Myxococcota bacterium]|nr:polymer-forming cytoskeletal protein [Myxococcota bacterium]